MQIDLYKCVISGTFGLIGLDTPIDDVLTILGSPQKHSDQSMPEVIWKYECVEISFVNLKVASISMEFGYESYAFSNVSVINVDMFENKTFSEIKTILDCKNIKIDKVGKVIGGSFILFLENNVHLSFQDNVIDSMFIRKIQ